MVSPDASSSPRRIPLAGIFAALSGVGMAFFLRPASPQPDLIVLASWSWLLLAVGIWAWLDVERDSRSWIALGLLFSMALWVSLKHSDPTHPAANWFFWMRWFPHQVPKIHRAGWLVFQGVALVSLVFFLSIRRLRPSGIAILVWLIGTAYVCRIFFQTLDGRVIYSDDHPAFLYRMQVLLDAFPRLRYWTPWWNGGQVETAALSSGIALQAPVWMPLSFLLGIESAQPLYMAFTMFILTPALLMLATHWFGGRAGAVACAGVLAMASSHSVYLWALHMGTLGAAFAMPFIPAVAGLVFRILTIEQPTWRRHGFPLVLLLYGALTWPPSALMLAPIALGVLVLLPRWRMPSLKILLGAGILAGLILFPAYLAKMSNPAAAKLLAQATPTIDWAKALPAGAAHLQANLAQINPAVLFIGLLGVLFLRGGKVRLFLVPVLLVFVLLAGWGEVYKPQLQLTRSVVVLGFLAAIPAALWMGQWLEAENRTFTPLKAVAIAILFISMRATTLLADNEGPARFYTPSEELGEFREWITANVPEDTRLLFAGPAVHGYGRGHVAYLPIWTGRAMVACDYYHFGIKQVEYDMPPKPFRANDKAFARYMELYNVSHVVTYHADKQKVMDRNPDVFQRVAAFGPKQRWVIYKVKQKPSWFLQGSGTIHQAVGGLEIHLDAPDQPCVIKFNWHPDLHVSPPAAIAPVEIAPGITFIGIRPNGAETLTIQYRPGFPWL